jgi:hypothetical protein
MRKTGKRPPHESLYADGAFKLANVLANLLTDSYTVLKSALCGDRANG